MLHLLVDWEYPHWMMMAGAILVALGFMGFAFHQNRNGPVKDESARARESTPTGRLKAMRESASASAGGQAAEGEGEMTVAPRAPWTAEQDKKLRALVLNANSVDTIAEALNRTTFAIRRRANTLRLPLRKIARRRQG